MDYNYNNNKNHFGTYDNQKSHCRHTQYTTLEELFSFEFIFFWLFISSILLPWMIYKKASILLIIPVIGFATILFLVALCKFSIEKRKNDRRYSLEKNYTMIGKVNNILSLDTNKPIYEITLGQLVSKEHKTTIKYEDDEWQYYFVQDGLLVTDGYYVKVKKADVMKYVEKEMYHIDTFQ